MSSTIVLFGSLACLVLINVPIAASLGLASALTLLYVDMPVTALPSIVQSTVQKFSLLTIPLFVLAGVIMDKGGISKLLIKMANSFVGPVPGGLGYVAVLTAMFFAAISGSGTATVAAIGSVLIPSMIRQGYEPGFTCALSAMSGSLGTVIPPSITLLIYGMITGESISDLFLAGVIPGIVFGGCLCVAVFWQARKHGWKSDDAKSSWKEKIIAVKEAFWGLLSPIIVLGGIYSGIFTPTEAAAVAVIYSFIVGAFIYKELTYKKCLETLFDAARTTGIILFIIMNAGIFAWVLTQQGIAADLTELALELTTNKIVMLILINIIFLIAGCVMDNTSALFILVPILMPIAKALGIDMVHLGVVIILNLSIGQVTPPVGPNLYVAADIGRISFELICRKLVPILILSLVALALITYVPWFSLALVR